LPALRAIGAQSAATVVEFGHRERISGGVV